MLERVSMFAASRSSLDYYSRIESSPQQLIQWNILFTGFHWESWFLRGMPNSVLTLAPHATFRDSLLGSKWFGRVSERKKERRKTPLSLFLSVLGSLSVYSFVPLLPFPFPPLSLSISSPFSLSVFLVFSLFLFQVPFPVSDIVSSTMWQDLSLIAVFLPVITYMNEPSRVSQCVETTTWVQPLQHTATHCTRLGVQRHQFNNSVRWFVFESKGLIDDW